MYRYYLKGVLDPYVNIVDIYLMHFPYLYRKEVYKDVEKCKIDIEYLDKFRGEALSVFFKFYLKWVVLKEEMAGNRYGNGKGRSTFKDLYPITGGKISKEEEVLRGVMEKEIGVIRSNVDREIGKKFKNEYERDCRIM